MSEQSDLLVTGEVCGLCGVGFDEPHGFPVLCHACWRLDPEARADHQRATNQEL